jgi:hypothetical protein
MKVNWDLDFGMKTVFHGTAKSSFLKRFPPLGIDIG